MIEYMFKIGKGDQWTFIMHPTLLYTRKCALLRRSALEADLIFFPLMLRIFR